MSGPKRLVDQRDALIASMLHVDAALEALRDRWACAGGLCCPGCMFGADWGKLTRKSQRQTDWLGILNRKIAALR